MELQTCLCFVERWEKERKLWKGWAVPFLGIVGVESEDEALTWLQW